MGRCKICFKEIEYGYICLECKSWKNLPEFLAVRSWGNEFNKSSKISKTSKVTAQSIIDELANQVHLEADR